MRGNIVFKRVDFLALNMGYNDDPDQIYNRLAQVFMIWKGIQVNKTGIAGNIRAKPVIRPISSGYGILALQAFLFTGAHDMQRIKIKDLNQFTIDGN